MSKSVLQSIPIGDTHGFESVSGDRPYNSLLFTQIHTAMSLGGFAPNIAGQLDPTTTGSNKTVTIKTGAAFIIGHFFELKNDVNITISDAPANQHRWDIIAVRVDRNSAERKIKLVKITGTPSSENNTNNIPWSQLTNENLMLSSGIWEFPIAVVHKHGNANLQQDDLIKTLPSTNILEPFPVFEQVSLGNSAQTGFRVMIPNPMVFTNQQFSSESIIRCKFPTSIDGNKEATVVINNFTGTQSVIPLKDVNGTKIKASQLNGKTVEITVKPDSSEGIVKFQIAVFSTDIIDKTSFDWENKTRQDVFNEFNQFPNGTEFKIKPFNLINDNTIGATGYKNLSLANYKLNSPSNLTFTAKIEHLDADTFTLGIVISTPIAYNFATIDARGERLSTSKQIFNMQHLAITNQQLLSKLTADKRYKLKTQHD